MRLWRISNYPDLTGNGGLVSAGRWHSLGRRILYFSENPASALLERLVHLEIATDDVPTFYQLIAIEVPDGVDFDSVAEESLIGNWHSDDTATRITGDRWLRENRTALLRVPSAVVPQTTNWLLNPAHPDAVKARIVAVTKAPFDPRLFD